MANVTTEIDARHAQSVATGLSITWGDHVPEADWVSVEITIGDTLAIRVPVPLARALMGQLAEVVARAPEELVQLRATKEEG